MGVAMKVFIYYIGVFPSLTGNILVNMPKWAHNKPEPGGAVNVIPISISGAGLYIRFRIGLLLFNDDMHPSGHKYGSLITAYEQWTHYRLRLYQKVVMIFFKVKIVSSGLL